MKDKLLCQGYVRPDGSKGIRNKVLVIYTVECCRALSERIARHFQELGQDVEAVGTSSCLDNQADIRRLLRFSTHPNVGAVLAIGHGCEYTKPQKIAEFARQRGRESQWFYQQEAGGSVKGYDKGLEIVRELLKKLEATPREPMYLSELVLAGECGGSDFTSGLAGNALIGRVFDRLVDAGGTAIFEELCEGLGLKEYLAARAATPRVADDIRRAYDKTMEFCVKYGHFSIAPGNMDGGLTTIEEKSMGAMVKSGTRPIRGVLKIAQAPKKPGLYLLDTTPDEKLEPAHPEAADPSDMLDLIACGAHIVFLVTGRGHVVGTPVSPVIKVTGNPRTYGRMKDDIDFCAAPALTGDRSLDDLSDDLLELVSRVAQGERTNAERLGHREGILYFNYQDPEKVPCEWHF